ncbi:hypothetical protein ABPG72_002291 [Tetrahymena utriculariae]
MKQNFKLLFLASILAISCGLDDLGKPWINSFTKHKHYYQNQGFLANKQTEGTPQNPPNPTDPQPNKPDQLNQPNKSDQPNQPNNPDKPTQPNQPAQPIEEQGGNGWGIFFAIVIVILVIVGIAYLYNMYEEHIIKTEGTMKAELGIKKQNLNTNQKLLLNLLTFNSKSDEFSAPYFQQDVEVKHQIEEANKVVLGEYLQATFKQQNGQRLIICNYPCDQKMDCSYFEVELEKINSNNYDQQLSIGFISKSQLDKCKTKPDNYHLLLSGQKSVLYSSNGLVMIGEQKVDLNIEQITYGDTMGIGYTKKDQRIWITRNGEFLNPPPQEEIQKLQEQKKKSQGKKDEEEESYRPKEDDRDEIEEERLRKERVFKLKLDKQEKSQDNFEAIYPFVSTNFPCTIDINVGGYPFRFSQKEIATGLLK